PTGSQTVHSCPLLLRWDLETLRQGLQEPSPILFILTNTRSLPPAQAEAVTREVCRHLKQALATLDNPDILLVSRSDSTLRGHYPLESDTIAEELGPFDAQFLVPAFVEGGRITRHSTHLVVTVITPNGDRPVPVPETIPVHKTEFARDPAFPFHHSFLPAYVEEKTQGKIRAEQVDRIQLQDLRGDRPQLIQRLLDYRNNQIVAVDGETQQDLDTFASALKATSGKKYLFRSAASLLTSLAALPPQAIAPEAMGQYRRSDRPGIIIIGSHVQTTTDQLNHLLEQPEAIALEIPIAQLSDTTLPHHIDTLQHQLHHHWHQGNTPVLYTSRTFYPNIPAALITQLVTQLISALVQTLPPAT
ncbi:MAG: four-carbon acid sugar kinase family protein, partial [Cyanobacteria bacterium P01_H01_bin.130]